jgi:peptide/nickel transport system substrate-binding protein
MEELLQLHADGLWVLGLAMPEGDYRVVHNDLRNVPNPVIGGWLYPGPGPANFETFYYQD